MNKKNILYVEDNPQCRKLFQYIMESVLPNKHVLLTFDNAEAALEKMDAFTFDFVFLDIKLPGMSGIEAIRIMQAQSDSLATVYVAISAGIEDRYIDAVFDAGFDLFLAKPIKIDQLTDIITYY
ncbi:MAG: response regulator [Crocinitomicaceae bacterium]|nr:response regulator [Crocinitomicaceae bacterium]